MRKSTLLFAGLACASHGQRELVREETSHNSQSLSDYYPVEAVEAVNAFATMLLAFNLADAPASTGALVRSHPVRGFGRNLPMMSGTGLQAEREIASRRQLLEAASLASAVAVLAGLPVPSLASGGATAGRYTSIPTGERRYGRLVTAWVANFLDLESDIKKGEFARAEEFFKDKEKSFFRRFKDFGFLLGCAFIEDAKIPPDRRPGVKAFMKILANVEDLRKSLASGSQEAATASYDRTKKAVDKFCEVVEMPALSDPAWKGFDDWKLGPKGATTNIYGVESDL